jgi:hypothetical protein
MEFTVVISIDDIETSVGISTAIDVQPFYVCPYDNVGCPSHLLA